MSRGEINRLRDVYQRYGFELAKTYSDQVLVFTLKTGYFDNADIVPLCEGADTASPFKDFSLAGFACTVRPWKTAEEIEKLLFKGFFSVDSIRDRLKADYERFSVSIVKPFSDDAIYKYINAPYLINGKIGEVSPVDEIVARLNKPKPILFLIEAAAGFGKTCNAYELVSRLVEDGDYLPLFSELSRNREARIFRHILLYEIDRSFPLLGSRLVQTEMINGRVVTILDGFDELLRKSDDKKEFEYSEPMLETIGEFLTGSAKVVLTTRRTILFEGDAFHAWVEKHCDDFDLITIKINEPRITDWLTQERFQAIEDSGLSVENISNPVLLSYLRSIPNEEFYAAVADPEFLVERYFDYMLDRERTRQDLRISAARQHLILQGISNDMIQFGYTSEHRDYIVDHIQRHNSKILDEALSLYSTAERPTKEELANKLASHALLDRSSREPNKIGFINEFVLGHYVGINIKNASEWLSDDLRFIEPAVLSYQPRARRARDELWRKLELSVEFLSLSGKVDIALKLRREIAFPLIDGEVEGLLIEGIELGEHAIERFQFNDCTFKNCIFTVHAMNAVTFLNCRFYGNVLEGSLSSGRVYVLAPSGDDSFIQSLSSVSAEPIATIEQDRQTMLIRYILEKFWPVGRPTISHKHRPIKTLCSNNALYQPHELYAAVLLLKKRGILMEPHSSQFVEINFDRTAEIKGILEGAVL